jgi:hypothetical protein
MELQAEILFALDDTLSKVETFVIILGACIFYSASCIGHGSESGALPHGVRF